MKSKQGKFNLKVFRIEKSHYDLKDKSSDEIIEVIQENHDKLLRHKYEDLTIISPVLTKYSEEEFTFWSYCYNQPKDQYFWKLFLPDELTEGQDFNIIEFSFVLFIKYKNEIYCVIGGSGISVIKKYIDSNYGIELYQHIAKPSEDVILELNTRGIASNVSQKRQTFNLNQTILETLEYSEIPTKIKLVVREDLKKKVFKEFGIDQELALMEVGSYFLLRKKIGFESLKSLIKKLDQIRNDDNFSQLTLFRKVSGETLIDQLTEELKDIVVEDVLVHRTPDRAEYLQKDVIEIVHPSKLERFYECDKFVIREKYSRGKKDVEVFNRSELYFESTKHIFKNLEKPGDRFEIKKKLYTLNIAGFIEGKQKTYANFLSHITAELEYNGHKYFRIDGTWYYLDDKLLELMTNDAISYYERYRLTEDLLLPWPDNKDEDFYNKLHKGKQSFVLDKVLNDNIELCDILKIHDGKIYFIHVKNGFNTKMRELYIQVILSAKRLANDLKNTTGSQYLKKTLKIYNKKNPKHKVDSDLVLNQIKNKELEIVFVMAFKNNFYKGKSTLEKIRLSKSNIAKYSLVQVVKEIQSFEFGINLKDISEL